MDPEPISCAHRLNEILVQKLPFSKYLDTSTMRLIKQIVKVNAKRPDGITSPTSKKDVEEDLKLFSDKIFLSLTQPSTSQLSAEFKRDLENDFRSFSDKMFASLATVSPSPIAPITSHPSDYSKDFKTVLELLEERLYATLQTPALQAPTLQPTADIMKELKSLKEAWPALPNTQHLKNAINESIIQSQQLHPPRRLPSSVLSSTKEDSNDLIALSIKKYRTSGETDDDLWDTFQEDFAGWQEQHFQSSADFLLDTYARHFVNGGCGWRWRCREEPVRVGWNCIGPRRNG